MTSDRCPNCEAELTNGLCPRCLVRLGFDAPLPTGGVAGGTLDLPPAPGSVLETVFGSTVDVPRVLLRDTSVGEEPSPITRPVLGKELSSRYRIDGEIARGGMGAILKGRDPDLGRDVAIKVLREDHRDNADMIRRFVEEAQISGQLQHPGIAPIYELGAFGDARPFFSMKLVKGDTLAKLLDARKSPAEGLPRFLGIFESIAQTVAYAHARGVIHRDLKPSNVMVGAFGEVQVMDWGLAKVLPRGGVVDDAAAGKHDPQESVIATARSVSDASDLSRAGSVLGTPSYMAPEQARGEIDRIDERADVFALGSILCEILTGQPAFVGRASSEIQRKAARGDLADALSRLDASGADAELIAMAKGCLAPEPQDRPRDAGQVAGRMTAYTSGVQERAQAAERERAVAVARAVEERRRRKVQLALAASVLAFTILGGLSSVYYIQQRQARILASSRATEQVITLRDQALEHPEDPGRWQVALAALEQAEAVGHEESTARLHDLRTQIRSGLDSALSDRELQERLVDIRSAKAFSVRLVDFRSPQVFDADGSDTEAAYAQAFSDEGLDFKVLSPAEAGSRIRTRPSVVALTLASALDDWAAVRRNLRGDPTGADRLTEVARIADPDPWRNSLRDALTVRDGAGRKKALQALASSADFEGLGAISLDLLGMGLAGVDDLKTAEIVLRRSLRRHPGDVWVNFDLARVLQLLSRRDEAIRFYQAARALRPETGFGLAMALDAKGETDESIEILQDLSRLRPLIGYYPLTLGTRLIQQGRKKEAYLAFDRAVSLSRESLRLRPDDTLAYFSLGTALLNLNKPDEAIAALREAIRLRPDDVLYRMAYGATLDYQGKYDDAVAAYRELIRRSPRSIQVYAFLGECLRYQGKLDEAVAVFREAIRVRPDESGSHKGLGDALKDLHKREEAAVEYREAIRLMPNNAEAHFGLGEVLRLQGRLDEAFAEARLAIRINPNMIGVHLTLGLALEDSGDLDGAIAEFREEIRIHPPAVMPHLPDFRTYHHLAYTLSKKTRDDEAASVHREAIRLRPDDVGTHYKFGLFLLTRKKLDEAVSELRTAIRLNPGDAAMYSFLGDALRDQGKLDEAIAAYREAVRLGATKGRLSDAMDLLVEALKIRGQLDKEVADLREATRIDPQNGNRHRELGYVLKAQGKNDEAIAAFREAIRLNPDDAIAHYRLGLILRDQKKLDEAIAAFREAARVDARNGKAGMASIALGDALKAKGQLDEAVAVLRASIRLDPNQAIAQYNLGLILRDQKELDEAIAAFREAARIDARHGRTGMAVAALSDALKTKGNLNEAIASFREAIRLNPDDAIAHYRLGLILRDQKKLDEAIAAFREAARIDARNGHTGMAVAALGDALKAKGKLDESAAVLRELTRLDPGDAGSVDIQVSRLGEGGDWGEVVAFCSRSVERRPDDPSLRHRYALVLLHAGDREGYRRNCAATVEKFGRSEDKLVGEAARACLIAPDPGVRPLGPETTGRVRGEAGAQIRLVAIRAGPRLLPYG